MTPIRILLATAALAVVSRVSAHVPVETVVAPPTAIARELSGPSGVAPTPPARLGQTLPLKPTRRIAFDTREGTALSIDLSPDGRQILFDMLGDIYALPATGGRAKTISRGIAFDSQPAFSPDGRTVAFLSDRSGAENLWLMAPDGSKPRQLSFLDDNPVFASPAWSADGRTIFVTRYWSDRNAYELWAWPVDGGAPHVVVPNRSNPAQSREAMTSSLGAVATPDGSALYLATRLGGIDFDTPDEWRIARLDLASGTLTPLIAAIGDGRLGPVQSSAFRPLLSHDGRTLAYGMRRVGKTTLHLRDLATGTDRELAAIDRDSLQSSPWSDIIPHYAFTPDDAALIVGTGGGLRRIDVASGAISAIPFVAPVSLDLGPLVRSPIRQETGPVVARLIQAPVQSPDGKMLAFSALGQLYTMPLDGRSAPVRRTDGTLTAYHPNWSPDGKTLLFVSWRANAGGQIWSIPAEGGAPRQLTSAPAFYTHPVFTPDGGSIIAIRSSQAARLNTYLEFGQLRNAELVRMAPDGSSLRTILSGRIGGTPHFGADPQRLFVNMGDGVHDVAIDGSDDRLRVQAVGPNWYFAEGSAAADDLRISPDGKWALAQIAQQLHLIAMPPAGATIDLATTPHRRITDVGADFFGWADDSQTIVWSIGSTFHRMARDAAISENFAARVAVRRDTPRGTLLLRGATAITMRGGETIADADILIVEDHIAGIGPRGTFTVPAGTAIRDVAGKYVIPGLIDVHDHVADIRRDVLDLQPWGPVASLAYGVTTTFDPSSLSIDMLAYQDLVDCGQVTGSRIPTTGPALFSFNDFRSKAEVIAVLRRYRDAYRTFNLKQYRTGNRRVRQWIAEAAHELGMTPTTEGALSFKLDLTHILDGYSGNEHSLPPAHLYDDVTRAFAKSGTSYTLTLQITHGGAPAQDWFIARDAPHGDPKYARFAPAWFRDQKFWARPWRDPGDRIFPEVAASAARFQREGGLLAVGAHGEVPGLGTHWEMQAYAMGGMSPAEVLQAATIGGARTIGRDGEFGSLEAGKYADLVILDRNPLVNIANTLAIAQVMKNGRLYDGATLDEIWPRQRVMAPFWFTAAP